MLEKVPVAVGRALARARAGTKKLAFHDEELSLTVPLLAVESEAFAAGERIPTTYTADGDKRSPPLRWRGVPADAQAVVILVEDADSPTPEPLVHAIVWDLPGADGELRDGALKSPTVAGDGYALGKNSFLRDEYMPPDPPPGHGPHRYAFQLYALDEKLSFASPPGRRALLSAMREHVLAKGCLIGIYERSR
jgi:Raf kinase inhibitor-like YbhB/YbcL family protein